MFLRKFYKQTDAQDAVQYAPFLLRTGSLIVDIMLAFLLLSPVFYMISNIVYGSLDPRLELIPVIEGARNLIDPNQQTQHASDGVEELVRVANFIWFHPITEALIREQGLLYKFIVAQLLQFVALVAFFSFFWVKYAQTPGKMLLRIKIVDGRSFSRMSMAQAIIRMLAIIVLSYPMLLFNYIWIIFDKRHRSLHDIIAGTVVVKL